MFARTGRRPGLDDRGPVGIALRSSCLVLGTVSGFFGGRDDVMQRIIEVIQSFPTIPLWAALAAALPNISETFTMLHRYFLITVILSLVNWTGLARQIRAKVMSYRQADFTNAALVAGASDSRIIFVHMLPNAASHIIVVAALAIPGMILGETSLSLRAGHPAPMVSWGALFATQQPRISIRGSSCGTGVRSPCRPASWATACGMPSIYSI